MRMLIDWLSPICAESPERCVTDGLNPCRLIMDMNRNERIQTCKACLTEFNEFLENTETDPHSRKVNPCLKQKAK